jgi:hypothetical protein
MKNTNEANDKTAAAVSYLERSKARAQVAITLFTTRLAGDPFQACQWADGAMEAAAQGHVAGQLLAILRGDNLATAIRVARAGLLSGARSPERSTSVSSNFTKTAATAAYAAFLDEVSE